MNFYQYRWVFDRMPAFYQSAAGIVFPLLNLLGYVLTAWALYSIAKRRCINNAWLAWIPIANLWVMGSLSDQYRYVVRGEIHAKRRVLLILTIISMVMKLAIFLIGMTMVFSVINSMLISSSFQALAASLLSPIIGIGAIVLPLIGLKIAIAVIRYMAMYDIYTSCDPQNNVLFLVLSILFGFTAPVFLFVCRNKDYGMPPRRDQQPEPPMMDYEDNFEEME